MNAPGPGLFPDVVIRASAGTGKTFQLSNRYLALATAGEPPEEILATTFTRKAAAEILDRILVRLAEAALDPRKSAALGEAIGQRKLDQASCLEVLGRLLAHLHRLRVGTLDHFFVQMARSFCLELGLPPAWQILDEPEDQRLRAEAVGALLEGQSTQDTLRLVHLLGKGEVARSVHAQITALVKDLYQIHVECPAEAWDSLPRVKPPEEAEVAAALLAAAEAPLPPDKRFAKARDKDLELFEAQQWEAFVRSGLAKPLVVGTGLYHGKPIPGAVAAAYEVLIARAKAEVLGAIANQTRATGELLARYDEVYTRLKLARRALRFDDVTRRLGEVLRGERLDQVVFRLDAHLAHLLLDEFQDTSPPQWRVLRPFARRLVGGRPRESFFCVGDAKQAIYGWRGGMAEILEAIDGDLAGLEHETLNRSYRSAPPVIETVNRVFGSIGSNQAVAKHEDAAKVWALRFAPHATARTDLAGYAALRAAIRQPGKTEQHAATLACAVERVACWRGEAPGASIGVLARRNQTVAQLVYRLRQAGIEASEEGGNPLVDSPAVELLLSLLWLADHPGDTASRFHVAKSPLGGLVGLARHDDTAAAWRLSRELRGRLARDGYGLTLDGWTALLARECDARDLARLVQLVELGYGYDAAAGPRVDDFVAMVRNRKMEDPSSAPVRVMTVHQAKGLQFDVVVLPELDFSLCGQPPRLVAARGGPTEPIHRVCRYVGRKTWPLLPAPIAAMFTQHENQVVGESLCLLYVALTRAVHALEMIIAPSAESEKTVPGTLAGVLREALAPGPVEPETVLFETGDRAWARRAGSPGATAGLPSSVEDTVGQASRGTPNVGRDGLLAPPSDRPRRGLDRRSPSQLEGGPRVELAWRMRRETAALAHGTLLHAWFEQIAWLEEGVPDDSTLRAIASRLGHPTESLEAPLAAFREALEKPAVRAALSRAAYDAWVPRLACPTVSSPLLDKPAAAPNPDTTATGPVAAATGLARLRWRVWRERTFALRDEGAILTGSIDRLVVLFDGDRPVAADVLDFKTDAVDAADPAAIDERVELYRPQLAAYRRAVAAIFSLDPARVSARLVFLRPGVVAEV